MAKKYKILRLILGDQLNIQHSWFEEKNDSVCYVMMEALSETNYVLHHIQKVCGFFLAMRAFVEELKNDGHEVIYLRLDDPDNEQSISKNIKRLVKELKVDRFEYQLPDEYRLDKEMRELTDNLSMATNAVGTEHFLTERMDIAELFEGKKSFLMETFYRKMRKKYDLLMEEDGETPLTGRWNYDEENRKKLPKSEAIPEPLEFKHDASEIVDLLNKMEVKTFGEVDAKNFPWPVTRKEGLQLLDHFVENCLEYFGKYQDAMTDRGYLLFHSKLSFAINTKLLHPLEVVKTCIDYWEKNKKEVSIAQIEGYVRQVIGWREYMRGIYWAKMPDYGQMNYFEHKAKLPEFYWTGKTKMKCLQHAITQSLEHAYAHHIQRLMVTGNFALLLGVDPDEVDNWYLGIYMDAIEWVEITNTRGMSQFADGGIVGTKPYVSSANYIGKMSDYCSSCHYYKTKRHGERACPFNSLYWDFYDRHTKKLKDNHRVGMMYRLWEKQDPEEKEAILKQADHYKKNVNEL